MKKIFLSACFLFLGISGFSQQAIITKEKGNFTQTEKSSKTIFKLSATEAELKRMKEQVSDLKDRLIFSAKPAGRGLYDCVLTVTDQAFPEYVHKMFLTMGIQSLVVDGKETPISELPAILKSML